MGCFLTFFFPTGIWPWYLLCAWKQLKSEDITINFEHMLGDGTYGEVKTHACNTNHALPAFIYDYYVHHSRATEKMQKSRRGFRPRCAPCLVLAPDVMLQTVLLYVHRSMQPLRAKKRSYLCVSPYAPLDECPRTPNFHGYQNAHTHGSS